MAFRKYSADIKVLAVRWRLAGLPRSLIRQRLRRPISKQSFSRWIDLYHHTRAVIRDPHHYQPRGRHTRLNAGDRRFMETLIDDHPSLFLDEIQAHVYDSQGKMLSISTIQLELQTRLMITLKKAGVSNVRKDLVAKFEWMETMMGFPASFLVFTDESSICGRDLLRKRQRSKKGRRTTRDVPRLHRGRYSILPAIGYHDLLALSVLEGPVNRKRFERFLKYSLLPRMNQYPGPNSVLVLDNASIHHGGEIEKLCDEKGILLKYLPAYCPELNPIELGFNCLKSDLIRSQVLACIYDPVEHIEDAACNTFQQELLHRLYARCGYKPFD